MEPPNKLFCFGFGYCANALTKLIQNNKWSVVGTSRTKKQDFLKNLVFTKEI